MLVLTPVAEGVVDCGLGPEGRREPPSRRNATGAFPGSLPSDHAPACPKRKRSHASSGADRASPHGHGRWSPLPQASGPRAFTRGPAGAETGQARNTARAWGSWRQGTPGRASSSRPGRERPERNPRAAPGHAGAVQPPPRGSRPHRARPGRRDAAGPVPLRPCAHRAAQAAEVLAQSSPGLQRCAHEPPPRAAEMPAWSLPGAVRDARTEFRPGRRDAAGPVPPRPARAPEAPTSTASGHLRPSSLPSTP